MDFGDVTVGNSATRSFTVSNTGNIPVTVTKAKAPARGERVQTPEGPGRVVGLNVPSETVKVRLDETGRTCSCSLASVCGSRQEYEGSRKDGTMRWDAEDDQ